MIVLRLQGGLGNQLFQLAAYEKMQRINKDIYLDVSDYNLPWNNFYRKYLLNKFTILTKINLCIFSDSKKKKIIHKFLTNIQVFSKKQMDCLQKLNFDSGEELSDSLKEIQNDSYIYGYFLNERFFSKNFKDIIMIKFPKKKKYFLKYLNEIESNQSVSVHIRRTDYLNENEINNYGNICTLEYYNTAIKYFLEKDPSSRFFFFSDDLDWVKKQFGNNDYFVYVSNPKKKDCTLSDLFLMSKCKHNIIANSTFSWWGAYFNDNPEKVIIRPHRYQNNKDIKLFPANWIDIELLYH